MAWYGMVWYDLWCGVSYPVMSCHDMAWYSYGMYDMICWWYDMLWYGKLGYGIV